MPSGMAARARELFAITDRSNLVPQESVRSQTGYKNVIEVGGKYQARLQVKGDGRGGERKRKQHSLPGLFDTALEAALYLAFVKQEIMESMCDENGVPRKQNKIVKKRGEKAAVQQEAEPEPLAPMQPHVFAFATPITCGVLPLPIVAVSPSPMQSLGLTLPICM